MLIFRCNTPAFALAEPFDALADVVTILGCIRWRTWFSSSNTLFLDGQPADLGEGFFEGHPLCLNHAGIVMTAVAFKLVHTRITYAKKCSRHAHLVLQCDFG